MKKFMVTTLMFGLGLVLVSVISYGVEITPKLGLDVMGTGKMKIEGFSFKQTVGTGFNISIEAADKVRDNILVGGGLEYQLMREVEKLTLPGFIEAKLVGDAQFNFVPIYGLVKILLPMEGLTAYGKFQMGYNILFDGTDDYKGTADLHGGLHYGFGGGVVINDIVLEILYGFYKGTMDFLYEKIHVDYSKIGLSVGMRFGVEAKTPAVEK